jgi:hypothetical protein
MLGTHMQNASDCDGAAFKVEAEDETQRLEWAHAEIGETEKRLGKDRPETACKLSLRTCMCMEQRLSTFGAKHCRDGSEEDREIEAEAPVLDVFEIQRHISFEGWITSSSDLPQASQAGAHV